MTRGKVKSKLITKVNGAIRGQSPQKMVCSSSTKRRLARQTIIILFFIISLSLRYSQASFERMQTFSPKVAKNENNL